LTATAGVRLGDVRNKAKKLAQGQSLRDAEDRRRHGLTVFYFDFNPKLTRRGLSLGEAIRHLMRVTGTRIAYAESQLEKIAKMRMEEIHIMMGQMNETGPSREAEN
jgi:hypothetical protein